jgi:hypothetical protein
MDALRRIYRIRECKTIKKNGAVIDLPYETAAAIAKTRYPEDFQEVNAVQQRVDGRQKLEAALEARRGHAVEVPTSQGGEPMDPAVVADEALRLMNSKDFKDMTAGEKEIIKAAYRKEGYSEEQINKYLI